MPKTVILSAARTPIGKLGGGLASLDATSLGATRDHRGAGAGRGRARRGPARRHGTGAAGRAGADPVAPGTDQGRDPEGGLLGDDQQGLRVRDPRRRDDRRVGPRGRPRHRGRGRHGVDVERALSAQAGAVRLPDGRRQDARRDGQRRADEPVQRPADVRRGDRGRRRAGADPPGPGPLGAALASAGDQGDRRGPAGGRDRAGHGQDAQGRDGRRDRRGAAPRLEPRVARQAPRPDRQGGLAHRRQLAGRQRRRRRAGARLRRLGGRARQAGAGDDHRPGARSPTTSPTSPGPRPRRRRRRSRRSA